MTDTRSHSPRDELRAELGALLRDAREKNAMSLGHVSRVTKIPPASLERLEGGRFDELPAHVFVRGFLKSYACCVGLDAVDVMRRFVDCEAAPRKQARAATESRSGEVSQVAVLPGPKRVNRADGARRGEPTNTRTRLQATGSFLRNQLFEHESPTKRRGAVTLAVIILVIVATLTMSYLLRRPSYNGDGFTQRISPSSPSASV